MAGGALVHKKKYPDCNTRYPGKLEFRENTRFFPTAKEEDADSTATRGEFAPVEVLGEHYVDEEGIL